MVQAEGASCLQQDAPRATSLAAWPWPLRPLWPDVFGLWVLAHRITEILRTSGALPWYREGPGTFRSERFFMAFRCAAQQRWEEPLPGD